MFDFSSAELTAWLASHEQWILVGIAATAFLESLAIVGVVVPGVAILFAMAAAAGSADYALLPVLTRGFYWRRAGRWHQLFPGPALSSLDQKTPPPSAAIPSGLIKANVSFNAMA